MSIAQITTAFQPRTPLHVSRRRIVIGDTRALKPSTLRFPSSFERTRLSLKCSNCSLVPRRSASIVCASNSGADSQGSPWKAFEKALGNVTRGRPVEEVLKQQIQKKEYYSEKDGNGGGSSGGSGRGGGDADGSGGAEDEGFQGILDETLQVILATAGFIFLYIYIIEGEEMLKLAKDYIKYIFRGTESVRLNRAKTQWKNFWDGLKPIEVEEDPYWLEREIINTPTLYDCPEKYRQLFGFPEESTPFRRSNYESDDESDQEEDDDNVDF